MEKALVKNAADKEQVKAAKQKERSKAEQEANDMSVVLSTREGRRYLWRLLSHCKVFASVWHSSALIHYNSGMQDVGHYIMSEIMETNPEAWVLMMKENKGD